MIQHDTEKLREELLAEGIEPHTADRLVRETPDVCGRQLSYLDYQDDLSDRASTLLAAIEGDWPEPARSYWANATRRAAEEKADEAGKSEAGGDARSDAKSDTHLEPDGTPEAAPEPDEDVRNLLAALESIAVMSHAHREDEETRCPVCVAWEALKQWGHRRAMAGNRS